jgi:hypothetical protein
VRLEPSDGAKEVSGVAVNAGGERFQALALDYDGTLTSNDRLAEATVAALEGARRTGLQLVLPDYLLVSCDGTTSAMTFVAPPRATRHVRHLGKYADHPVAPPAAFVFRRRDGRATAEASTLRAFLAALREVEGDVLVHHASRGDFSRWIADVFVDRQLANRLRKIERRWRDGDVTPLRSALTGLLAGIIEP